MEFCIEEGCEKKANDGSSKCKKHSRKRGKKEVSIYWIEGTHPMDRKKPGRPKRYENILFDDMED